jgi:general secretion pathway protein D
VARKEVRFVLIAAVALALVGCGAAKKAFNRGEKEARRDDWDQAVMDYAKASILDPENALYKSKLTLAKVKASQRHLENAKKFREAGQLEMAIIEYQQAKNLDPTNQYVATELDNTIEDLKELREKEKASVRTNIEEMKQETSMGKSMPYLNPASQAPITMNFPANTKLKDVYKGLCKAAGINVLFDEGIRDSDTFSIDLSNVSFKKALDQVAMANHDFYKIMDQNTIMVIPDNPNKRRDYEDNVIKTFYLSNAQINDVMNILRSLLDTRKIATNPALNAITVRDTPAKVAVAERIIRANDKSPAEVVIDVEILEIVRQDSLSTGLNLSSYSITEGLEQPDSITTGSGSITGLRLSNIPFINRADWLITFPDIAYTLFKSTSHSRMLARPSLRALDGKQVQLRLGDQVPIETSTFTGGVGNYATRNFQFRDIGINIDITPRIHHNNEVTLQLRFEVTSIGNDPDGSGPIPPTFGNRTVNTEIRLKDGETNLLAGLFTETETKSLSGLPGVISIPGLKNLLGSNQHKLLKTDIVLTLTPHIVRTPNITREDLEAFWVGTEQNVGLQGEGLAISAPGVRSPFEAGTSESSGGEKPAVTPSSPTLETGAASQGEAQTPPRRRPRIRRPAPGELTPPSGEQQTPTPESSPPSSEASPAEGAGAATEGVQASAPAAQGAPGAEGTPAPSSEGETGTPAPENSPAPENTPQPDTPPAPAVVGFSPAQVTTTVGSEFQVDVVISNATDVGHVPHWIQFDPNILQFVSIAEGDFMNSDGTQTSFLTSVQPSGTIIVGLSRLGRRPGVSGEGRLCSVKFKAVAAGTATLRFSQARVKSPANRDLPASFGSATVTVGGQ